MILIRDEFGEGAGTHIRNFCWRGLPQDFGIDGGTCPPMMGGGQNPQKMPRYLVLKGSKKFCGAYGASKIPLIYPDFCLYCGFKKQFFEKKTREFCLIQCSKILLFIAFLRYNFFEKSPKFSKKAPSAPNFGRFAPKI